MMTATELLLVGAGAGLLVAPLVWNLGGCWRAVLNDARAVSLDPALQNKLEILYAYPGFWALFWYRLSHALLQQDIPVLSLVLPRLVMAVVRYCTAIDIHPAATISEEGIFIDHGTGLVVGADAVVGAGVTLFHGVTLGSSGKKALPGKRRHPAIGDRVLIGAGAKILGDIVIGDDVLVGANSVVTKPVPANHTAVGIPARILCRGGASTGTDIAGAAICELHQRLARVERKNQEADAAGAQLPQQKQQQQPAGEGREPSPLALRSPSSSGRKTAPNSPPSSLSESSSDSDDVTFLSSPLTEKKQQQQQQQREENKLPESGVEQILYSQKILSAAA